MDGTEFLSNFASTTAGMVSEVGLPLLYWALAFIFLIIMIGFVYSGFHKGAKKAFR